MKNTIFIVFLLAILCPITRAEDKLFGGDAQDKEACEWLKGVADSQHFKDTISHDFSITDDFDGDGKNETFAKSKELGEGTCHGEYFVVMPNQKGAPVPEIDLSFSGEGEMNRYYSSFTYKGRTYVINHSNHRRDEGQLIAGYVFKVGKLEKPYEELPSVGKFPMVCALNLDRVEVSSSTPADGCQALSESISKMQVVSSQASPSLVLGGITWKLSEVASGAGCGCDNSTYEPENQAFEGGFSSMGCGGDVAIPLEVNHQEYYALLDRKGNPIQAKKMFREDGKLKAKDYCEFDQLRRYKFEPVNKDDWMFE